MYPVTSDFLEKMRADRRQVFARVEIDYTDPFIDQSLEVEANEQANVSYPQQTADSVDQTTHKYACLDGTWDLTSGEYHLAPSENQLTQQQFGWWGAQFADQDGYFASLYPTLTVTHLPRPIRQLKVVGDTAREEYPVDFTIKLYAQDDTLLKTETVTGNDQVSWQKALEPQVLDVAKQELIITRWSLPGTCAKIIEFFTSIREVYETGDLVSLRLLEEREASQGSLPVGNISANEVTIALNNESKKFDIDNENSPLKNLLKPNRRIQAWLGAEAENAAAENPPTFTRNSVAYQSDGTKVAANVPRFEQGKFGKAVLVEEGTTNRLINPLLVDSDSNGLADNCYASNATNLSCSGGVQTFTATAQYGAIAQIFDFGSATGPWSFSAEIKGLNGRITVYPYDVNNVYLGNVVSLNVNNDQDFTRVTCATTRTDVKKINFRIEDGRSSGWTPISFRRPQVEIGKAYATSFIDGTRSPETLAIPTAGVLNPQEGTIEFWWCPINQPASIMTGSQTVAPPIIQVGNYYNNNSWILWCGITGRLSLYVRGDNATGWTGTWIIIPNLSWYQLNRWYHFVVRWENANTFWVFIDGVKYGPYVSSQPFMGIAGNIMSLGKLDASSGPSNALFDDLRISNRARTDEEIFAAYQSNKPLHRDEHTTYLLSFNGSIYPVEQCWVPLGTFWSLDWDSPDDTLEATVTARDRMELLRKGTYQTSQVLTNKSLYELAEIVLQDAGLNSSEYIIDTDLQSIIIPYAWFNPVAHREALRRIAEAGLAAAFQNRDGKIQIESFLLSGDEPVLEITEDDYFPPLRAPSRQDQVANEIIVDTQPLRPAAVAEEVYKSNEPITIPASTTKTITAFYNKTPVIEATASLDNPPAGVSITEATYYGWGASVKIQNTNATDKQVTLVINGKPLTVQNKERAIARDEASILENGVLTYEFPANPLVQTLSQAQTIADALLASVKEPRRDIEVEWRGNPALELGDRVTVKGKDYHIIRQEINWQGYLSERLTGRRAI